MTGAHIFYIPMILLAGIFLGFGLGKKAAAAEAEQERRRQERRAAHQRDAQE